MCIVYLLSLSTSALLLLHTVNAGNFTLPTFSMVVSMLVITGEVVQSKYNFIEETAQNAKDTAMHKAQKNLK